jgi:hydrogenase maturation protease
VSRQRTLILGVGNPVLCDDGVGVQVAQRLEQQRLPDGVIVAQGGSCGLGVLDLVAGFDRLIIVDAIDIDEEPGAVLSLGLDDLDRGVPVHFAAPHDVDLLTALKTGRRLEIEMPSEVRIVAIQVQDVSTFSERCTPPVANAIDEACRVVLALASAS